MRLVCVQIKKKKVKYTFNIFISYLVQAKKTSALRQNTHNILKTIMLIAVLIWRSFSFLHLKEKDFPETRSWWAAVCIEHYSVLDGHWPARPFGNALTDTERLELAAQQGKIPFWKELRYYPKRGSNTLRALEGSVSHTGVFSLFSLSQLHGNQQCCTEHD